MAGRTTITTALQVAQGEAETAQQDQHAEVGGWRTNLYGPLVTTACSCRTTTVVVKSRPRSAPPTVAEASGPGDGQSRDYPQDWAGRLRVWCNANTSPAANPPTMPP